MENENAKVAVYIFLSQLYVSWLVNFWVKQSDLKHYGIITYK